MSKYVATNYEYQQAKLDRLYYDYLSKGDPVTHARYNTYRECLTDLGFKIRVSQITGCHTLTRIKRGYIYDKKQEEV